jgi:hypothetical protein
MQAKYLNLAITIILSSFLFHDLSSQPFQIKEEFLVINAMEQDPLYTTYTASMERSRLYGDKGYKMVYDDNYSPLSYGSEQGGRFFTVWEVNSVVVDHTGDFFKKPVVRASFPDMAILEYQPWPGLKVEEVFFVYSSRVALVDCFLSNTSGERLDILILSMIRI